MKSSCLKFDEFSFEIRNSFIQRKTNIYFQTILRTFVAEMNKKIHPIKNFNTHLWIDRLYSLRKNGERSTAPYVLWKYETKIHKRNEIEKKSLYFSTLNDLLYLNLYWQKLDGTSDACLIFFIFHSWS